MNAAYGSSGSFLPRVYSKYIEHNTYTVRRLNLRSNTTRIHGPVHKYDLNCSYSKSQFCWLSQQVAKELTNRFSQKVSYAYMEIDSVIDEFGINEVKSNLHICDCSILALTYV